MQGKESVPLILESDATGKVAEIYADIRQVLGTSIVNLIWRNLATIPGALEWTWIAAKPLYRGPAAGYAEAVRRSIDLPVVPSFSRDTLALVVLSALVMQFEPTRAETVGPSDVAPPRLGTTLPELPPTQLLKPEV